MTVHPEYGHVYDHDVSACSLCNLSGDYFQDRPCPECGHTATGGRVIYENTAGGNYRMLCGVCDRCRMIWRDSAGFSVFSFDETGPGDDISGYRCVSEAHNATKP